MLIGYARVSTEDQSLALQRQALAEVGCQKIFDDRVSGVIAARPGLSKAMKAVKAGDVLVVWKLDRLGRSFPHLLEVIQSLADRRIGFRSLTENMDTTTASGRLLFHLVGALADFERSLIRERTSAGIRAAKARGVHVGRRKALTPAQVGHAQLLIDKGESASTVARTLKIGRSTLYRYLSRRTV